MAGKHPLNMERVLTSHDCVCAVATHRECARELTLRCAAEVTEVWIPVQVCRTFQTRDFLHGWSLGGLKSAHLDKGHHVSSKKGNICFDFFFSPSHSSCFLHSLAT